MDSNKRNIKIENSILELADNMASAAATFNAHGYSNFVNAREELKEALTRLYDEDTETPKHNY